MSRRLSPHLFTWVVTAAAFVVTAAGRATTDGPKPEISVPSVHGKSVTVLPVSDESIAFDRFASQVHQFDLTAWHYSSNHDDPFRPSYRHLVDPNAGAKLEDCPIKFGSPTQVAAVADDAAAPANQDGSGRSAVLSDDTTASEVAIIKESAKEMEEANSTTEDPVIP